MNTFRQWAIGLLTCAWLLPCSAVAQSSNPVPAILPEITISLNNQTEPQAFLPAAEQHDTTTALKSFWDRQLRFESENKQFSIHVGGSLNVDSTWLIGPESVFALPGGAANGAGNAAAVFLRRVRFRLEGQIYELFDYVAEYDFANANNENSGIEPPSFGNIAGSPAPFNVWVQVREVPWFGKVRFGNQTKPIGMTTNTNQAFLPFMERADNMDAFYGQFDSGFSLGLVSRNISESERITWQYGIYRPSINIFGVGLTQMKWGGRVTALPVYENDGCRLIHIGLGTENGELPENQLRVRARPLLRNGPGYANPILVDTGEIPGNRQYTLAPEFAAVDGHWTFQAEWTGQWLDGAIVNGIGQGMVFYHGGYAQLLYFLTGEHQRYMKEEGSFGRVVPRNNYNIRKGQWNGCTGAWQVGARFSYLDLNNKAVQGGTLYDWTLGLNWYLNPNVKVQFNYILEHRDQPGVTPGWINGFGLRAGVDF